MTKGNTSKPGTHGQNSIKGLNIRINMLKKEYTLIKGKRVREKPKEGRKLKWKNAKRNERLSAPAKSKEYKDEMTNEVREVIRDQNRYTKKESQRIERFGRFHPNQ
jgi:hypothetical protein